MKKNNPSKVVIIPKPPVANAAEEEAPVMAPKMAPPPVPCAKPAAEPAEAPAPAPTASIPQAKPLKDMQKKIDKTELPQKPIVK
jgi:hypothetical protein